VIELSSNNSNGIYRPATLPVLDHHHYIFSHHAYFDKTLAHSLVE
jgi:hypothetical protein